LPDQKLSFFCVLKFKKKKKEEIQNNEQNPRR
jgi:hypothetical protein